MSGAAHFVPGPELAAMLVQIDEQRARIDGVRARRPDLWPLVLQKLKLRWTADSNAIEGSTLSFGETKFFIEQGLTVEGKPLKDFLDARNHWEALDLLFDVVVARQPVTPGLLKELNALILRGVDATAVPGAKGQLAGKSAVAGEFKSQPNHVLQPDGTIHRYVEPIQVASEVEALCKAIEMPDAGVHPVMIAAFAHYDFVRIHPFDDGNGRGARILMNLILLRHGYQPAVVPLRLRRHYHDALALADRGQLDQFVQFIAGCIHETQSAILTDLET